MLSEIFSRAKSGRGKEATTGHERTIRTRTGGIQQQVRL